jgi:RecB family endonuclease NucS
MEKDYRERKLEEWLYNNPQEFEDGLRWISRQRKVFWRGHNIGKTDLQGVDQNGTIAIIELKAKELNHHDISQALCYWRSISTHEACERPRLIFIGKSMSTRFRIVLEWIKESTDLDIEVYFYEEVSESYSIRRYDKEKEESFYVPRLV